MTKPTNPPGFTPDWDSLNAADRESAASKRRPHLRKAARHAIAWAESNYGQHVQAQAGSTTISHSLLGHRTSGDVASFFNTTTSVTISKLVERLEVEVLEMLARYPVDTLRAVYGSAYTNHAYTNHANGVDWSLCPHPGTPTLNEIRAHVLNDIAAERGLPSQQTPGAAVAAAATPPVTNGGNPGATSGQPSVSPRPPAGTGQPPSPPVGADNIDDLIMHTAWAAQMHGVSADDFLNAIVEKPSTYIELVRQATESVGFTFKTTAEAGVVTAVTFITAIQAGENPHDFANDRSLVSGGATALILINMVVAPICDAIKNKNANPNESNTHMTSAVSTYANLSIDPSLKPGVDSMLSVATKGAVGKIDDLLQAIAAGQAEITKLSSENATLQQQAAMASVTSAAVRTGTVSVNAADLSFTIIDVPAWQLFGDPKSVQDIQSGKAKPNPLLDFNVPTFEWKDQQGNVVRHPDCPEVDPAYQFRPDLLARALFAYITNTPAYLTGHTGTGKTSLMEQIAAMTGAPFTKVNLDSEITRLDFVGRDTLTSNGTSTVSKFVDGILPRAMATPGIFCLDEVDFGRSDILYVIQGALEKYALVVTEDGGRKVEPHPWFRFVATGNTKGQGDEWGLYQGARPQSEAFRGRFGCWIDVPYMDPATESKMLATKITGLPKDMVNKAVKMAKEIRLAFTKGEMTTTMTPRDLLSFGKTFCFFTKLGGPKDVAEFAMGSSYFDKLNTHDRQKAVEFFKATF